MLDRKQYYRNKKETVWMIWKLWGMKIHFEASEDVNSFCFEGILWGLETLLNDIGYDFILRFTAENDFFLCLVGSGENLFCIGMSNYWF